MTNDHFYSSYNGFTIIEVALVLAIAGLIFLVVFLALPALQNSQADNARRQAVGRVVSAVESYLTDNPSATPWTSSNLPSIATLAGYYGSLPDGIQVVPQYRVGVGFSVTTSSIIVDTTVRCRSQSTIESVGSLVDGATGDTNTQSGQAVNPATDVAVIIKLSSGNYYCQDI